MSKMYGTKPKKKSEKKVYTMETLTFGTAKNKWVDYVKQTKGEGYDAFLEDIDYFIEDMEEKGDWETLYDESYVAATLLLNLLCPDDNKLEAWKKTPISKLDNAIADVLYKYAETQPFMSMYSFLYASALLHFIEYVNEKLLRCFYNYDLYYDNLYEARKAALWITMRHEFQNDYEDEESFKEMYRADLGIESDEDEEDDED